MDLIELQRNERVHGGLAELNRSLFEAAENGFSESVHLFGEVGKKSQDVRDLEAVRSDIDGDWRRRVEDDQMWLVQEGVVAAGEDILGLAGY